MQITPWLIEGVEYNCYNVLNVQIGAQLIITMCNDEGDFQFNIIFDWFQSFSIADESYRLKILYETRAIRGGNGVFWKLEDSPPMQDFFIQSLGFADGIKVIHYAIYTDMDCIDIISTQLSPLIQLL